MKKNKWTHFDPQSEAQILSYPNFKNAKANYEHAGIRSFSPLRRLFKYKPAIVVGSGPSLNKNIRTLAELYNPDKATLVVANTALPIVAELNLKPTVAVTREKDFENTLEGSNSHRVLERASVYDMAETTPLVAPICANQNHIKAWPCEEIYLYYDLSPRWGAFHEWRHKHCPWEMEEIEQRGRNCGFDCIGIARHLGASEVILVGMDSSTAGGHHYKGYETTYDTEKTITEHTANYNDALSFFIDVYGGDFGVKTINCTEGGAITEQNTSAILMPLEEKLKSL